MSGTKERKQERAVSTEEEPRRDPRGGRRKAEPSDEVSGDRGGMESRKGNSLKRRTEGDERNRKEGT